MKEKTLLEIIKTIPKVLKELVKPLLIVVFFSTLLVIGDLYYCNFQGYKKQINFLNQQYALSKIPLYACYKNVNSSLIKVMNYKNGLHFEHNNEVINKLTITDYALFKRGYKYSYLYNINRGVVCKFAFHKKPLTNYINYVIINLEKYNSTLFWKFYE